MPILLKNHFQLKFFILIIHFDEHSRADRDSFSGFLFSMIIKKMIISKVYTRLYYIFCNSRADLHLNKWNVFLYFVFFSCSQIFEIHLETILPKK